MRHFYRGFIARADDKLWGIKVATWSPPTECLPITQLRLIEIRSVSFRLLEFVDEQVIAV